MINIKNKQRKIKFDIEKLKKDAIKILELIGYPNFDLGILITNNKNIQIYNKTYRNKDKPTDILSFAYHDYLKPGQKITLKSEEDKNLGDLILSAEYIKNEAEKLNVSIDQRMRRLLVHGICHLIGYDHIEDNDWRRMRAKEGWLLKKLNTLS